MCIGSCLVKDTGSSGGGNIRSPCGLAGLENPC